MGSGECIKTTLHALMHSENCEIVLHEDEF